jgi:hypothetical protein
MYLPGGTYEADDHDTLMYIGDSTIHSISEFCHVENHHIVDTAGNHRAARKDCRRFVVPLYGRIVCHS